MKTTHDYDSDKICITDILNARPELYPAVSAVLKELLRAKMQHHGWPSDPIHAVNIITEEVGELATDANDFYWRGGPDEKRSGMRNEAVQVGAMALRFLLHLDEYSFRVKGKV